MDKTLLSIICGLGGMFGFGASDFLANDSSAKVGYTATFFYSQIAGLMLAVLFCIIFPWSFTSWTALVLAFVSGIFYAAGYLLFYKGFELGNVSVVSAVVNFQGVLIMIGAFLWRGERLTPSQLIGVILVMIGVFLVSVKFSDLAKGSINLLAGVKETLLSTIFFASSWIIKGQLLSSVSWNLLTVLEKSMALIFVWVLCGAIHTSLSLRKSGSNQSKILLLIVSIGVIEALGIFSVNFGTQYGSQIIVTPIYSALTLVTVGLAVIFTHERPSPMQLAGIVTTVVGIVITAL